jgi:hypothetical protein
MGAVNEWSRPGQMREPKKKDLFKVRWDKTESSSRKQSYVYAIMAQQIIRT